MKFFKNILGFNSPYSWVKWLRCSSAAAAVIFAAIVYSIMDGMSITNDAGIAGMIIGILFFVIIMAPLFLIMLGIAMLIGLIFGGRSSIKKQKQSLKESAEAGSEVVALDKLRIKTQSYNVLKKVLWAITVIVGVIVFFSAGGTAVVIYAIPALVIMIFISYRISVANNKYSTSFKENIVKAELQSVLENVDYKPNDRFNDYTVKTSGLFPGYDSSAGSDYFSADYKGRRYIQSDLHLERKEEYETTDSDGNSHTDTRYVTLFRGRIIMFDYKVVSNGPVYIYDKKMRNIKSEIQTEFVAFNEKYLINAADAVTAFHILTPQMMEKIMLVAEKISAPLSISFLQDKVFVAVSSGDAFEANTIGDITLTAQRERIKGEVSALVNILEALFIIS